MEWKNSQRKKNEETKTEKAQVKKEADMVRLNTAIQKKSRALGVLDSVSATASNVLFRKGKLTET